jgi:RNA polymerase sigma-70 factor (ECF subfamily)
MADIVSAATGAVPVAGGTALSRDAQAKVVEELFYTAAERLGRFLAQMVRDRALAEDLLQETFEDALRHRADLGSVENPEAWLFGIARHRALATLRRQRRLLRATERLVQRARRQAPAEDVEVVAVRDLLERHLKPEERALLVLRYLHGYDAGELSAITGLSPEAVRQRLSRARARLVRASSTGTKKEDRS